MIFIVFIILTFTYFFVQYFQKQLRLRNEKQKQRQYDIYTNLLNNLKDKTSTNEP